MDDPVIFLLVFALIVAVISGVARWLGASRLLAFAIPNVPLVVCFVYSYCAGTIGASGHGPAIPLWIFIAILLAVSLPTSVIMVLISEKRSVPPPK